MTHEQANVILTKKWEYYTKWLKVNRLHNNEDNRKLFDTHEVYENDLGEVYLDFELELETDINGNLVDQHDTDTPRAIFELVDFKGEIV